MNSALIISTYNWPEALELVLKSVRMQKVYPDEVIIADDGSTDETKKLINKNKKDFPVPLKHFWHQDKGFRKSHILNLAIANSNADYIIQIDGDCILDKFFIKDHLHSVKENTYLFGSRVNINASYVDKLFLHKTTKFNYFSRGLSKRNRLIRIPLLGALLYRPKLMVSKKIRGCNLSYWKSDLIAVNGYNEDMVGWGREDSEIVHRMNNNGVFGKRLKFKAILFHIWHKNKPKDKLEANNIIQENAIKNFIIRCKNGIDKYLE